MMRKSIFTKLNLVTRMHRTTAFAACLCLCGTAGAYGEALSRLSVDVAHPGAIIDRHIFGQFAEHLGHGIYGGIWVGKDSPIPNTRGIRNDVVAALREIRVPVIRWPGGCFADEYHWRNGIGASKKRAVTLNPNWGGVLEPNTFGTHEFFDLAEQIGAEAYVSVNVGSGTVQESADWLEYMTAAKQTTLARERATNGHPVPFKVPYLGVGNESWGCGGSMTPGSYVDRLKVFTRFVRNYDDTQHLQRIAVGPDGAKTEYTEAVMKAWQGRDAFWSIEGLSLHNYTLGKWPPTYKATGFGERDYVALLSETLGMDQLIRTHSAIMDKYDPEHKVSLVVDEWGVWLAPLPGTNPGFLQQQNSQRDAIIAALNLNIFARHADRVRMANIAQMVNVLQAMIFTDGQRILLTPTYEVFRLYAPFHDAVSLPIKLATDQYEQSQQSLPRLDAIAARGTEGAVWIAVVNLDAIRPAELALEAGQMAALEGQTLESPAIDSVNTFDAPHTVKLRPIAVRADENEGRRVFLPPHSISVMKLMQP